jgi:hypothetical protein
MKIRASLCGSVFAVVAFACGVDAPPIEAARLPVEPPQEHPVPREAGVIDATPPFTCDADPAIDPRVISEACGVFVAPARLGGGDERSGEAAHPLATVQRGLDVAQKLGRRWAFLCASEYAESVAMRAEHAGIRVYGALACPDEVAPWSTVAGRRARVQQPSDAAPNAPVWRIEDIGLPVILQGVEVVANDAKVPSASSVALFVQRVASLELRNVRLVAGKGADGTAGAPGVEGEWIQEGYVSGGPAYGATGGVAQSLRCTTGGSSAGGAGGTATKLADGVRNRGTNGSSAGVSNGVGSSGEECQATKKAGTVGTSGSPGLSGTNAAVSGRLAPEGWSPAAGTAGTNGTPGGGGGGGGAGLYEEEADPEVPWFRERGGGGSGGAGSCGGGAGGAGQGGGGSFSVVLFDAQIVVAGTQFVTSSGGAGGASGTGRVAFSMEPGIGFKGWWPTGTGCQGGAGGQGGRGGDGGGGAGGLSVGVLANAASVVTIDAATRSGSTLGAPGNGGAGADGGSGLAGVAELVRISK